MRRRPGSQMRDLPFVFRAFEAARAGGGKRQEHPLVAPRAGLTGDEVADRLGWSASKISRIELHRIGIKQADLLRLLDLYRVADVHRGSLVALADEARRTGRLEAVAASLPGEYAAFLYAEAEAKSVWTWDPQIVPGLLQTADYARAVMLR